MDRNSVVDLLKSLGQDSSFQNRQRMWSQAGSGQYTGSQQQNDTLRQFLTGRKATPTAVPSLFSNPNAGYQLPLMPQDPRMMGQGRGKAEILKEMIEKVSALARLNPKDPMIGMYRQFIRSKLGQMEEEIPQL